MHLYCDMPAYRCGLVVRHRTQTTWSRVRHQPVSGMVIITHRSCHYDWSAQYIKVVYNTISILFATKCHNPVHINCQQLYVPLLWHMRVVDWHSHFDIHCNIYFVVEYNIVSIHNRSGILFFVLFQFSAFYSRLTEGSIGITGWKLFHINKLTTKMVYTFSKSS